MIIIAGSKGEGRLCYSPRQIRLMMINSIGRSRQLQGLSVNWTVVFLENAIVVFFYNLPTRNGGLNIFDIIIQHHNVHLRINREAKYHVYTTSLCFRIFGGVIF